VKAKVVGIGGVSCSGKTTVTNLLKKLLPADTLFIDFDSFYIPTSKLKDKNTDWESPEHFRYEDFLSELDRAKREHDGLIIAEGFLIFYDERARELFDKRIFIDLPEEIIKQRRIDRKRGTDSDTIEYINGNLIPGQRKFVYPQKQPEELAERICQLI
jgi:uridine kinase